MQKQQTAVVPKTIYMYDQGQYHCQSVSPFAIIENRLVS